ncbi:hypothetical protein [Pseudonocardia alaniniphila]|uniref:Anti-sigma-M factor RsmA n=1 Tax=Pseudonocardia alaniniphila TaxID=75291 RepID=A0ABS9TD99_9PSEU|nr:hypothetical protein [Pseudonocardia alaniniphila]MCH6166503.1 hypothetical protein [Pseudonocardia alaniniphila]
MTTPRPDLTQLADLDAGVLEPARAAQVRAAAAAHPESAAVLHALAVTRGELAGLPPPPVPPEFAARWAAALEAEAATGEPSPAVSSLDQRRPARWRRPLAVVGAAAVLVVLVLTGVLSSRPQPAPSIDRVNLAAVARSAVGSVDAGPLADPARRAGCLRAAAPALAPDAPLVGGRQVTVDGQEAVLLVLVTGRLGTFDVVVVDSECGPGHGTLLESMVVGG